jgi:hypothetical protein
MRCRDLIEHCSRILQQACVAAALRESCGKRIDLRSGITNAQVRGQWRTVFRS